MEYDETVYNPVPVSFRCSMCEIVTVAILIDRLPAETYKEFVYILCGLITSPVVGFFYVFSLPSRLDSSAVRTRSPDCIMLERCSVLGLL